MADGFIDLPHDVEKVRINAQKIRAQFQAWHETRDQPAHPRSHFAFRVAQMERAIEKLQEAEAILNEPVNV